MVLFFCFLIICSPLEAKTLIDLNFNSGIDDFGNSDEILIFKGAYNLRFLENF
ncbi:hypothetical protein GMMP1_540023 [Candidatus Magnetomoraceae bacterium gMMP-1]